MKTIGKYFLCISLVLLSGCQSTQEPSQTTEKVKKEEVKKEEKVELKLSFVGDITLGNYAGQGMSGSFNQEYNNQNKNSHYFLKNVKSIFEKDDLTIANLEGPLTTASSHQIKTFAFKGKPEYVEILKKGNIDVVTLANNHSQDYYSQGMKDTKKILKTNKIAYFGYETSAIQEVKGIKIGFLGYAFPYSMTKKMKQAIQTLKEKTDIVVVYYHWGIEGDGNPMASQREIAKQSIDNGADLVIGSHPHVLQGYETYKGKNIVYSLGNFCFGGNKNPRDKDTAIYQHTFQFTDKKLTKETNHIIPCRLSSQTSRNNYQPTVVKGADAKRVLKKIHKMK